MFRKLRDRLTNRVGDFAVGALIIGLVTELLGFDIAPAEVDAVVTGFAMLGAFYDRWRTARALKREAKRG